MAVNFDFDTVPGKFTFTAGPLTWTEGGVDFTLSIQAIGGFAFAEVGGGTGDNLGFDLTMSNSGGAVARFFTLTFTDNLGNSALSGNVFADTANAPLGGSTGQAFSFRTTGGGFVAGTDNVAYNGGPITGIRFSVPAGDQGVRLVSLSADSLSCFLAGTLIATTDGARAVEDLQPGDRLRTADGGETEVQWLGRQTVQAQYLHPARINPIRISAGALGKGVPKRDLFLSPDHAVALDGMLVNAGALVNGTSIAQVRHMPFDGFTYYHVETEGHELILAEGCAAESYLDMPSRTVFDNGAERADGPTIREMDLTRISSARHLPETLRARLGIARSPSQKLTA